MVKIIRCPTCDSPRIRKVRRTIKGARRGQAYQVKGVLIHECPDCGERLYDHAAMQQIEAARPAVLTRSRRAASA